MLNTKFRIKASTLVADVFLLRLDTTIVLKAEPVCCTAKANSQGIGGIFASCTKVPKEVVHFSYHLL